MGSGTGASSASSTSPSIGGATSSRVLAFSRLLHRVRGHENVGVHLNALGEGIINSKDPRIKEVSLLWESARRGS